MLRILEKGEPGSPSCRGDEKGVSSWTGWASQRNTLVIEECYKLFDTFNNLLLFIRSDCQFGMNGLDEDST